MSAGDSLLTIGDSIVAGRGRDRTDAVTALVEREASSLLQYFLRRTAEPEDAADLLGETLLIVWRRERAIPDDDTRARMWLFGVARKVLSGQHRSATRRAALTGRLAAELAHHNQAVQDDDLTLQIRELLASLGELDQEIIKLVYWDGFTLAETAELLGLRANTIRSRHARAQTKLRNALADRIEETTTA